MIPLAVRANFFLAATARPSFDSIWLDSAKGILTCSFGTEDNFFSSLETWLNRLSNLLSLNPEELELVLLLQCFQKLILVQWLLTFNAVDLKITFFHLDFDVFL